MNLSLKEALDYTQKFHKLIHESQQIAKADSSSFIFLIPACYFSSIAKPLKQAGAQVGGQNCYIESTGSYTGENSASLFYELGASYCLAGHSERRNLFNEDEILVSQKLRHIYENYLAPILCLGESKEDREAGRWKDALEKQLKPCIHELKKSLPSTELLLAYEPYWSIGTGDTPTVAQLNEVYSYILNYFENETRSLKIKLKILYGGSVNAKSLQDLKKIKHIDGFLIGGASLQPESLLEIYKELQNNG